GETIEEALKREVKEETGADIEVGDLVKVSEFDKKHEEFDKRKSLRYLAYYNGGKISLSNEHRTYKWIDINKAPQLIGTGDGYEKDKGDTIKSAERIIEMKDALDKWTRVLADMENLKKRTEKDKKEFQKYCIEEFILELLPVLDNFEMALKHVPKDQENNSWIIGILYIKDQLFLVLKAHGVDEIKTKPGDEIDENIHHVLSGKAESGKIKVKKVLKKGYAIDDRIIRPVNVEAE
ncbi:MAG: nucleotide exchange factor GrpE, partial [Patescibacteria group bacterium]|nr:nucleotide exchange factor GrpE [Patescibacteria group bacterium]